MSGRTVRRRRPVRPVRSGRRALPVRELPELRLAMTPLLGRL
ncbi:hypothetical protein OOK31_06615 [Streptomyces sp. NBC_00249]|nr:hypothetical protein [Streptomyces sp. NBC_00249]MCX5193567.1 hypothetical protein [Streptomyces sp. NBC_00249]